MNDSYFADQRDTQILGGLLSLVVGAVFTIGPSLAIFTLVQARDQKPLDPIQVLALAGGVAMGLVGLHTARYLLWQLSYEVRFDSDHDLVFVSPLAREKGSAQDIVSVQRTKGSLVRGFDPRELRITHRRGVIHLHYLRETEVFIFRLENANPAI